MTDVYQGYEIREKVLAAPGQPGPVVYRVIAPDGTLLGPFKTKIIAKTAIDDHIRRSNSPPPTDRAS
jgi:hypothetical protein